MRLETKMPETTHRIVCRITPRRQEETTDSQHEERSAINGITRIVNGDLVPSS